MGPVAVWQPAMQVVLGSLVLGFLGLGHSKQLGDFVSFQHGIRGSLEEGSAEGRLRIRGFSYDGRGPGGSTYFYVVNSSAVYSPEDVARVSKWRTSPSCLSGAELTRQTSAM